MKQDEKPAVFDLTIVGAGPVGLFAAFYAGLRELSTKIIDSLEEVGGQLTAMYPEKYIYDMPGFPKVLARELVERMAEQGLQFGATLVLGQKVVDLTHLDDGTIKLTTDRGEEHLSRTVLLALGAGSVEPAKLGIPGEEEFAGRGVAHVVKDRRRYQGKRVVIVGGGDTALDWANELFGEAASITLVHRTRFFRAHERSVRQAQQKGIPFLTDTVLVEIMGSDRVEKVRAKNRVSGEEFELPCDEVLICIGFRMKLDFLRQWGLELSNRAIKVDQNMRTNLPGVYAAGDITDHEGKLNLIATGVGEAAIAVNHIATQLNPEQGFFPGHSTNMAKFGGEEGPRRPVEVEGTSRPAG